MGSSARSRERPSAGILAGKVFFADRPTMLWFAGQRVSTVLGYSGRPRGYGPSGRAAIPAVWFATRSRSGRIDGRFRAEAIERGGPARRRSVRLRQRTWIFALRVREAGSRGRVRARRRGPGISVSASTGGAAASTHTAVLRSPQHDHRCSSGTGRSGSRSETPSAAAASWRRSAFTRSTRADLPCGAGGGPRGLPPMPATGTLGAAPGSAMDAVRRSGEQPAGSRPSVRLRRSRPAEAPAACRYVRRHGVVPGDDARSSSEPFDRGRDRRRASRGENTQRRVPGHLAQGRVCPSRRRRLPRAHRLEHRAARSLRTRDDKTTHARHAVEPLELLRRYESRAAARRARAPRRSRRRPGASDRRCSGPTKTSTGRRSRRDALRARRAARRDSCAADRWRPTTRSASRRADGARAARPRRGPASRDPGVPISVWESRRPARGGCRARRSAGRRENCDTVMIRCGAPGGEARGGAAVPASRARDSSSGTALILEIVNREDPPERP